MFVKLFGYLLIYTLWKKGVMTLKRAINGKKTKYTVLEELDNQGTYLVFEPLL